MSQAIAKTKYLRVSPRKMVGICKLIRGKDIAEAKAILLRTQKRGAKLIAKTLASAIANAKNKNLEEKNLFIEKITADSGPSLKRWILWSRGSMQPIHKRTTHLTIILGERVKTIKKASEDKKRTVIKKNHNF